MSFVKISGQSCNAQGQVSRNVLPRTELYINSDLIGVIHGTSVILKNGDILRVGGSYYKSLQLANGVNIQDL